MSDESDYTGTTGTYRLTLTDMGANATNLSGIRYEPIQRRWLPLRRLW